MSALGPGALCVSNIAWHPDEEAGVARALAAIGVRQIEIAPLRAVPVPWEPDTEKAKAYRAFWASHGIAVYAMQALLFGRDGLGIFGDAAARALTFDHLSGVLGLAELLGVKRLVFGSPLQRLRGERADVELVEIAVDFFSRLGEVAVQHGAQVCIEPNPPQYGCTWVTTAVEGAHIVRAVAHPGFGLHLDAAGMYLAGDRLPDAVQQGADQLGHVHFSAPQLGHVDRAGPVDYAALVAALRAAQYEGAVSIEMRAQAPGRNLAAVLESTALLQQLLM